MIQWYIIITAFAFFVENINLHEVERINFKSPVSLFMIKYMAKSLVKSRRKFFRTPTFPLEVFAENEKGLIVWKKY